MNECSSFHQFDEDIKITLQRTKNVVDYRWA